MSVTEERLEGTKILNGACIYCGQIYQLETTGICTEEQLDRWATEKCDCGGAKEERRKAKTEEAADIMRECVDPVIRYRISSITIDTGSGIKGKVSLTGKGMVKVEKNVSRKTSLEA